MRDEFSNSAKRVLAERVGFRCSNPNCRQSTSGPRSDPSESVNIGVAAHITAAALGGPRYDPDLSADERRGPENGIWLCQNCAKLVDNDPERYTAELLYSWKSSAESQALQKVRGATGDEKSTASLLESISALPSEGQRLPTIPPGIRPSQIPPFHHLDEYTFQDLCRDLFDAEPDVASCEIYGVRGQSQYGIDLLAYLSAGDGIEVGQCKCYEDFPPREIRKASDEFFKHWNRWSKEKVQRFILFVASDLSTRQRQDEVFEQRKRFASLGIKYEAWSAAKIQNKLRPHPGIVSTYLVPSEHWVNVICGPVLTSSLPERDVQEQTSVVVSTALVTQIEQLSAYLSSETEERLELMRKACREGRRGEAIAWLSDLRADTPRWKALSSETKAKLLNFEAGLVLDTTDDIKRTKQLADQALDLAPSENQTRLRAHLAWRENGPEAAIKMLEGHSDVDSLNLKAILLLEMGHIDESLTTLSFADGGDE